MPGDHAEARITRNSESGCALRIALLFDGGKGSQQKGARQGGAQRAQLFESKFLIFCSVSSEVFARFHSHFLVGSLALRAQGCPCTHAGWGAESGRSDFPAFSFSNNSNASKDV